MTAEQFLNYTKLKHQKQEAEDKGTETLISRGRSKLDKKLTFTRRKEAHYFKL